MTVALRLPGASPARIHQALLGAGEGSPLDHDVARRLAQSAPWWPRTVQAQRRHAQRMVRHLAIQSGQFLDLGCGLPTAQPVHRIASAIRPSRTVYVDRDADVHTAWRIALAGEPNAAASAVRCDIADIDALLDEPAVQALDWTRPISVLLDDVAHFLDDETMTRLLAVLRECLPRGSTISLTHVLAASRSHPIHPVVQLYRRAGVGLWPRHLRQVTTWRGSWPAHILQSHDVLPWCAVLMRTPGPSRFLRPAFWPRAATSRASGREVAAGAPAMRPGVTVTAGRTLLGTRPPAAAVGSSRHRPGDDGRPA
ncbi:SAM-dependent methyltransferase [Streptomyces misionensis]|uniref:SAM-dependent methyltransferase n=1 Tax=Streptomyces misionensis TaxID=67331 RepID=UPI00342E75B2